MKSNNIETFLFLSIFEVVNHTKSLLCIKVSQVCKCLSSLGSSGFDDQIFRDDGFVISKKLLQSEGKLLNLFQSEASASPRIQLWISFIVEILLMLPRASLSRKSFAGIWQQFLSPTSACYQTSILTRPYPSPAFERSRFHSH